MSGVRAWVIKQAKRENGQTMTEFALIVVLIAVVLITSLTLLRGSIATALQRTTGELQIALVGGDPETSPLGSTFSDISQGLISLIYDYYNEYGKWPSSYQNYAFSALGLDPNDWNKPINHIRWTPEGVRMSLSPETGYNFYVTSKTGTVITVPAGGKIYYNAAMNNKTGAWGVYDATGTHFTVVDIKTLVLP